MNWPRVRLKYVARFGYGDALVPADENNGSVEAYGSNGPYSTASTPNTRGPAIIVGRKGSYGKVTWSQGPCFATDTTFYVDATTTSHELRWLYWLMQTLHLDEGSDEAAVPGLNRETAYGRRIPLPPATEQHAIADYLDRETARIDALVAAKERLLGILAEKRRALISHAVTKGLDPNVLMKDSGVEWLGKTPGHWETERARWLLPERDERSERGGEELLTVSHITGVTPRSEKKVYMFEAESTEGYKICHAGDLVVNTLWAWMGAMGVAPVDGIVSPAYNVYIPTARLEPAYLDALVRTSLFTAEVTRFSKGVWSSRLRLYPEGLHEVHMPVPSLPDQRAIVVYISAETAKLDAVRAAAEKTIGLLKERRAALISAAVTGKVEVAVGADSR